MKMKPLLCGKHASINAVDAQGRTTLHCAVLNQWEAGVSVLLKTGADVEAKDTEGNTALYHACSAKHHGIVKLLLDAGADINSRNCQHRTPLDAAVLMEDFHLADKLLQRGADIYSHSLFSVYCKFGNNRVIQFLLDKGSNLELKDHLGKTPLLLSCEFGNVGAVKELLARGADVTCKDTKGFSALHYASTLESSEIVELLLDAGCDLESRNKDNQTPLLTAMKYFKLKYVQAETVDEGYDKTVLRLIQRGAKVNVRDYDKMTPLAFAIQLRNLDLVRILLVREADVNAKTFRKNTSLHFACQYEFFQPPDNIAQELIAYGADVNVRNKRKETPLHIAVKNCDTKTVIKLLKEGADVGLKDTKGNTPLCLVKLNEYHSASIVSILLQFGANPNDCDRHGVSVLTSAVRYNNIAVINQLLAADVDVHSQDDHKETALHWACFNISIVEKLLAKGASVNIANDKGNTPLKNASHFFHDKDIVEMLLKQGGDVNHKNNKGETTVNCVTSPEIAKLLLLSGCSVNEVDNEGNSPLHNCFKYMIHDLPGLVQELLIWGASVSVVNRYGVTPLGLISRLADRHVIGESIKKHIVLSKAASLPLESPLDVNLYFGFDHLSDFQEECLQEIDRMTGKRLGRNCVFDVISKSRDPTYLSNHEVKNFVESLGQSPTEFPIYESALMSIYRRATRRRVLMDLSLSLLPLPLTVPRELRRLILVYLDDGDLETLTG